MAEEYKVTIDATPSDSVIDKIQDKLNERTFEINAMISEDSLRNIQSSLQGMSIQVDANMDNIKDNVADLFVNIGGGVFELNRGLEESVETLKELNEIQGKTTRTRNLELSNAAAAGRLPGTGLFGKAIGAAGILGGGLSIREGVNINNQLEILSQRTGLGVDVLGKFISGLATGTETIDPERGLKIAENISNAITDLLTGTSPEGAKLLNLLGLGGKDVTREEVFRSLLAVQARDFGDKAPEVNRLFEQLLGVNFNAIKSGQFQESLFLSSTETKDLNQAVVTLKTSFLSLSNDITSDLLPVFEGVAAIASVFTDAYKNIPLDKIKNLFPSGESSKEMITGFLDSIGEIPGKYERYKFGKGFERLDESGFNPDSFLGREFARDVLNAQLSAISSGSVGTALDIKKLEQFAGSDLNISKQEATTVNLRSIEGYLRDISERSSNGTNLNITTNTESASITQN